jgi:hypothetical protein
MGLVATAVEADPGRREMAKERWIGDAGAWETDGANLGVKIHRTSGDYGSRT